jgi:O-antigen/teichoic acid export membrane protein
MAVFRLLLLLVTVGATWLAVILTQNVVIVLLASLGSTSLGNLGCYLWTSLRERANDQKDAASTGYGKRLSALHVLMAVESRADHVLVGTFLSFEQLGWFNMADRICDAVMKGMWTPTAQMFFPRLAEASPAEARRRLRVWGAYLVVAFALLAAAVWLLVPWLVPWLLGPRYNGALPYVQWLVVIAAVTVPCSAFEVYAQARAQERALWSTRLVLTVTHLLALPLLLKWWGIDGVLLSMGVSRLACLTACVWWWRRGA